MVLVAGCGFEPLYGRQQSGADASTELNQIAVSPIPERLGQMLRIELTNELTPKGQPRAPAYVLDVRVSESKQDLAIRKDATATRANLIITSAKGIATLRSDPASEQSFRSFMARSLTSGHRVFTRSQFRTVKESPVDWLIISRSFAVSIP